MHQNLKGSSMRHLLLLLFFILETSAYAQIDHWETAVYADSLWKYRLGTSEPPGDWNAANFDDTSWLEGEGSIGYADDDDNTIISPTESLYMRRKFDVADKSKVEAIVFHADYDDGFVAYLNGIEIARANLEGNPPPHDAWTPEFREALMYQGGLPIAFNLAPSSIQQLLNNGENVLSIQTHNYEGLVSSDMTTLYWLSFGISDTSSDYGPTPDWFITNDFETPLPIVKINTWGEYIPDEPSIQAEMGIIWNGDGQLNIGTDTINEYFGNITIERRGQYSQMYYPKNGYSVELKDANWEDMDSSFLNFPREEDWVLHGPYADKTLIRNVLAMEMANKIGQYASRTRLVELLINEQYEGVYALMERIKRDENRVDIAKLRAEDISGDELTGGYIIKCDKGDTDWYSLYDMVNNPGQKLRFQYVSPKRSKIQPQQEAYIQSFIDSFEIAMKFSSVSIGGKFYYDFIDLPSFADHFILQELTKNVDAYRISFYMYKDKDSNGGLLKAGPVWDFNFAFGNADYCNSWTDWGWVYDEHCGIFNPFWWGELFEQDLFINLVKCRWEELRNDELALDSILAFVDEKALLLEPVVDRNFQRWPVLDGYVMPSPFTPGTYEGEIDAMKSFITDRMDWMDQNIFGLCGPASNTGIDYSESLVVSPNPTTGQLSITTKVDQSGQLKLTLLDIRGKVCFSREVEALVDENQEFILDVSDLKNGAGVYILRAEMNEKLLGIERIVVF